MGIFDYIGGKMQEAGNSIREAEMEAEGYSAKWICDRLKNTLPLTKLTGYVNVLKRKAEELDNFDLKELFEHTQRTRNVKAFNVLAKEMEERNLVYRDSDGKVHKNY